jgi:hypothetical protein
MCEQRYICRLRYPSKTNSNGIGVAVGVPDGCADLAAQPLTIDIAAE